MQANKLTNKDLLILRAKRYVREWSELLLLPFAILTWIIAPKILHLIDPFAATFDAGVLHKFVYAILGTITCHLTVWIMLKISFPSLHKYFYVKMEWDLLEDEKLPITDRNNNTNKNPLPNKVRWQRLHYSLALFGLYVGTFLVVLLTL